MGISAEGTADRPVRGGRGALRRNPRPRLPADGGDYWPTAACQSPSAPWTAPLRPASCSVRSRDSWLLPLAKGFRWSAARRGALMLVGFGERLAVEPGGDDTGEVGALQDVFVGAAQRVF